MLDLTEIKNTIEELENAPTTFANCQKLVSLYIVLNHINTQEKQNEDTVIQEYSDILPAYTEFCKIKKQYQLNQTSIETVTTGIKDVCKEIYEFLQTLYNNSDIAEERHILVQSIKDFLNNI